MRLSSNPARLAPTILGLLLLVGPAQAVEDAAWDQERVSALAADFQKNVDELNNRARTEDRQPNQSQRAEVFLLREDISSLTRTSRRLSRHLSNGEGRTETEPLFRRMMVTVRSINARRSGAPILETSGAQIDEARRILGELAAYYGEVLPPPARVSAPAPD